MATCSHSKGDHEGPSATKPRDVLMVRVIEGEPKMKLSFKFSSPNVKERQFNFERHQEETLGAVLARISFSVNNKIGKKLQKMKQKASKKSTNSQTTNDGAPVGDKAAIPAETDVSEVKATLLLHGQPLPDDVLARDAFADGAELCVSGVSFLVRVNPPSVRGASLPKTLMAGFSVAPRLVLDFCTPEDVQVTWFRVKPNGTQEQLAVAATYTPTVSDIDAQLKIVCAVNAGEGGNTVEILSHGSVESGPGPCPFDRRHPFTTDRTFPRKLRVVSYNILADLYASSDYSQETLFPTCPPYALATDYRQQLLRKEILGYNADILCMQEVDAKVFEGDLGMALTKSGMQGVLGLKGGQVAEGVACFFRTDRFSLMHQHTVVLAEILDKEPTLSDLYQAVSANQQLMTLLMERTTAVQLLVLRCNDDPRHKLCVANTHLYFRPDADNIRLLQATCCLRLVEQVVALENAKEPGSSTAVMICGDFNSTPEFGVYQLMTTQCVPTDHEDWRVVPEEAIEGVPLSHPFKLVSACGTPEYTNFTTGFQGCLDYIFVDDERFTVEEVVPLPGNEEVTQFGALPSITVPSDHLALVCTLALK